MEKQTGLVKLSLVIIALLGWFAVTAQFYLNITSEVQPAHILIFRFFDYFTIDTNILVAVACTSVLIKPGGTWGKFFSKQQTLTAIAVYILVVGVIYNIILRSLWNPQGLQYVVNELLHTVIPALFIIYWLLFVPKNKLVWKNAWPWLLYPLIYTIYAFVLGAITGFYPYPFIDLAQLGVSKTLVNVAALSLMFFTLFFLFIAMGKASSKKASVND